MEVKINKEIRNYTESMFSDCHSGSSFFCPCLRRGGWLILSAPPALWNGNAQLGVHLRCVPLAAMGFIKYNGMTAEQFVWAWIKSEFLMPKKIVFLPDNLYYEALKPTIEAHEKGLPAVPKKQRAKAQKKPKKAKSVRR